MDPKTLGDAIAKAISHLNLAMANGAVATATAKVLEIGELRNQAQSMEIVAKGLISDCSRAIVSAYDDDLTRQQLEASMEAYREQSR